MAASKAMAETAEKERTMGHSNKTHATTV